MTSEVTFLVYLGSGAEGQRRLEALKLEAARRGLKWGGEPSLGRLITAIADELSSDAARLRAGAGDVPCAKCGQMIASGSCWVAGIHDEAYCEACSQS